MLQHAKKSSHPIDLIFFHLCTTRRMTEKSASADVAARIATSRAALDDGGVSSRLKTHPKVRGGADWEDDMSELRTKC